MILRRINGQWIAITQTDHAWASGEIARAVSEFYVDEMFRRPLLGVIARHDDGWDDWDLHPQRDVAGAPLNFTEISATIHDDIWRRSIDIAQATFGPYAAAVLARHAQTLQSDDDDSLALVLTGKIAAWTREAMPGLDPVARDWHVERGFQLLRFCDLVTLMPCAGWEGPQQCMLLGDDGRFQEFTLRLAGDWEMAIDPWPFLFNQVAVEIPVTRVPGDDWEAALAQMATGKRSTARLTVRRAE